MAEVESFPDWEEKIELLPAFTAATVDQITIDTNTDDLYSPPLVLNPSLLSNDTANDIIIDTTDSNTDFNTVNIDIDNTTVNSDIDSNNTDIDLDIPLGYKRRSSSVNRRHNSNRYISNDMQPKIFYPDHSSLTPFFTSSCLILSVVTRFYYLISIAMKWSQFSTIDDTILFVCFIVVPGANWLLFAIVYVWRGMPPILRYPIRVSISYYSVIKATVSALTGNGDDSSLINIGLIGGDANGNEIWIHLRMIKWWIQWFILIIIVPIVNPVWLFLWYLSYPRHFYPRSQLSSLPSIIEYIKISKMSFVSMPTIFGFQHSNNGDVSHSTMFLNAIVKRFEYCHHSYFNAMQCSIIRSVLNLNLSRFIRRKTRTDVDDNDRNLKLIAFENECIQFLSNLPMFLKNNCSNVKRANWDPYFNSQFLSSFHNDCIDRQRLHIFKIVTNTIAFVNIVFVWSIIIYRIALKHGANDDTTTDDQNRSDNIKWNFVMSACCQSLENMCIVLICRKLCLYLRHKYLHFSALVHPTIVENCVSIPSDNNRADEQLQWTDYYFQKFMFHTFFTLKYRDFVSFTTVLQSQLTQIWPILYNKCGQSDVTSSMVEYIPIAKTPDLPITELSFLT